MKSPVLIFKLKEAELKENSRAFSIAANCGEGFSFGRVNTGVAFTQHRPLAVGIFFAIILRAISPGPRVTPSIGPSPEI